MLPLDATKSQTLGLEKIFLNIHNLAWSRYAARSALKLNDDDYMTESALDRGTCLVIALSINSNHGEGGFSGYTQCALNLTINLIILMACGGFLATPAPANRLFFFLSLVVVVWPQFIITWPGQQVKFSINVTNPSHKDTCWLRAIRGSRFLARYQ